MLTLYHYWGITNILSKENPRESSEPTVKEQGDIDDDGDHEIMMILMVDDGNDSLISDDENRQYEIINVQI